jgi:hypothetical protein
MKNILTGRIDHLNFVDGETIRSTRAIRATRSTVAKLSLYIYIELGYGALQSTRVLCALHFIINFKSEMIDPNRLSNLHIKIY